MLEFYLKNFYWAIFLFALLLTSSCETKKSPEQQPNLFLQVVNEKDQAKDFAFTIKKSSDSSLIDGGRALGQAAIAVPADYSYDIQVSIGSYLETRKGVKWPTNTAKTLRFEFNDEEGEFVLDADENTPLTKIDKEGVTNAQKQQEKQKGIPQDWAEGTLYNANNVSCQYAGKALVFINQGGELYNLKTKKFSEGVIVPVGESLQVAAPANGAFLRAFISIDPNNSEAKGQRIAFVRFDDMYTGWWFAAGCKDGSKPVTNCNNGDGFTGVGSACTTLGEDN